MSLLVDTSVWSLALRRDGELQTLEVVALRNALLGTDQVFSTGLVLQELLQGFAGPKARDSIVERDSPPLRSSNRTGRITLTPLRFGIPVAGMAFRLGPSTPC